MAYVGKKDAATYFDIAPAELRRMEEKSFYLGEEGRKKAVMLQEGLRTAAERRGKLSAFRPKQLVMNGKVRARIIEVDEEHGRLRVRTATGKVQSWGPDFVEVVPEKKQGESQ